jgi:hypothetical protein
MALMEDYSKGKRSIGGKKVRSIKVPIYNPARGERVSRVPHMSNVHGRARFAELARIRRENQQATATRLAARQAREHEVSSQMLREINERYTPRQQEGLAVQRRSIRNRQAQPPHRQGALLRATGIHPETGDSYYAAKSYLKKAAKKSKFGRIASAVGKLLK